MFNIFRRSKNKTQPNINHPKSQRLTNTDKLASPNAENHQPLSEDERDYVRREVLPTAGVELDNLRGNAFEAAERSDNGNTEKEWREREKKLSAGAVAGAAASASASAKYVRNPTQDNHRRQHKNVDNFYFDERVNLAKTVPNFTANDTPAVVAACSANKQIITNSAAIGDDGLSRLAISKELRNTAERFADDRSEKQPNSGNSSRNQFEEQQRRVRTAGHKTNSFSNNNKKKDKQHFHRTKDEEYEYETEYVEPVNEKVATAAAIVAPSTNDLVRYRKSKKSSRNADNVCKRQSWLGLTLSNVRHRNKEEAVEADKNKTPTDERKTEEAPVRKSFFLSYSKSIDSDKQLSAIRNPRAPANAKRPRSKFFNSDTTTTATTNETRANSGERTKLEWSRDFLSEILMARGRNHKRQHNQQKKHQQQQQAEQHRQQQQQQEKQHRLQHVKQSPSNDLTSSSCSSPSSPAITDVDNHQPVIKICDDPKLRNSTHLETILDPAGNASTNNCQTTESKNNHKNSNSQSVRISSNSVKRGNGKPESESESVTQSPPAAAATAPSKEPRQMGATSPEHANELSTNQTLVTSATTTTSTSTSTSTSHSTTTESESTIDCCNCAEAIVSPHEQILAAAELGATLSPLNRLTTAEQQITDTPNIKRNVFLADPTTHTAEVKIATTNIDSEHLGNSSGTLKATKSQLNELTECDRDYREVLLQRGQTDGNQATLPLGEMGQSNVKPEARASPSRREFREISTALVDDAAPVALNSSPSEPRVVVVPTITVVDYSDGDSGDGSPVAQDVFYDFDSEPCKNADAQNGRKNVLIEGEERERASVEEGGLSICVVDDALEDDNVFHAADGVNEWQFIHSEPLRLHNHTPLTEVLEEEEEEVEDEDDENVDEKVEMSMSSGFIKTACDPEHVRHHLASTNSNDSNLSSSFYDSGIGSDAFSTHADSPAKLQTLDTCCDLLNERFTEASKASNWNVRQSPSRSTPTTMTTTSRRLPFVRDGNSTQCDPTLMQCDDFDFVAETGEQVLLLPNERLVCIESISLPDVVVESTATTNNNNNNNSNSNSHCNSLASVASTSSGSEHVIHINGATGNSMSNVHFVPIHVETGDVAGERQKRRSLDDSVIGGKKVFDHLNVHQVARTTIKITAEEDEDASVAQRDGEAKCFFQEDSHITEKLKRDLVNQESRFNAQLEDAQNNTYNLERKVNELQTHIESLEKDLALKTWNVERLQGELVAAHKDDEYVRKRLKLLEDEKTNLRHKYSDNEEEFNRKYAELEQKYRELEEKFKETCHLASELHTQLAAAQSEVEECREEMEKLRIEMQEQLRMLRNALENSEADRKISEDKWQKEFEMLRTHNQDREESLMTDCEWQLRQMQRVCKEKVDKAEYGRREAREHADILESAAQERLQELQLLRTCADEAKSLRGLASEQEISLQSLAEQIESLKADLKTANENLEEQIEAVRKIKYQCDNKIYDKERELIQRIDEVRNEAASFWENKLYTEMTRLKSELESVFIDERRDALDKLQAEHIEELRALTTRYTANEEELRAELTELQERLDIKNSEFLDLREKSDSALLQTRMHLDRADREYQNAMFREEARREALEESLRKEFENEKLEMEEKFRERLGQVKDEFARELQMSTQDMKEQHTMELEQQKLKLFAEKDEALQELTERHRKKLANAENQMKDIELRHQRDLKDLKATYDAEKLALDKRDISNANEIEQLHRKCRCLTNLFEEMRMRYERRDPRQEDLREIDELRRRCESQERDLYLLTDRLREMQMQMEELQQNGDGSTRKAVKKPQPKAIPTNCDVIYEENEERDSTPPPPPEATAVISLKNSEEQKLLAESCEREGSLAAEVIARPMKKTKINGQKYNNNNNNSNNKNNSHNNINNSSKSRNNNNIKCGDRINGDDDDDDGHMITAM